MSNLPPPLSCLLHQSTTLPHLLQLHCLLLKTAHDLSPSSAARLIAALAPLSVDHAFSIFHHLRSTRPIYAYNSIIRGFTQNRRPLEAIHLFSDLRRVGAPPPDHFTYPFVIKACGDSRSMGSGGAVHGLVVKAGFVSNSYVGNTLLHMYACGGIIGYARKVFDEMRVRDVVSWSSMIEAYVDCNQPREVLLMYRRMRSENVNPNSVTLVSLLSACSHLSTGRSIHAYTTVNKINLGVSLGTALVDMYARCGRIDESFQVFNSMEEKDLQTWTIMISGLADHGLGNEAVMLFSQLEMSSMKPDSMAFSGILSACSHLGLVDEGERIFNKMVNVYNIQPTMEHYGCIVDLYGRAGRVDAAYEFIRNMPVTPNGVILRSFLGACKIHGRIPDIDGDLMKVLLEEEPNLGANYVLAANVSALSGRWDEVEQLGGNIGRRGLKKVVGCSWVEVNALLVKMRV